MVNYIVVFQKFSRALHNLNARYLRLEYADFRADTRLPAEQMVVFLILFITFVIFALVGTPFLADATNQLVSPQAFQALSVLGFLSIGLCILGGAISPSLVIIFAWLGHRVLLVAFGLAVAGLADMSAEFAYNMAGLPLLAKLVGWFLYSLVFVIALVNFILTTWYPTQLLGSNAPMLQKIADFHWRGNVVMGLYITTTAFVLLVWPW